MSGVYIPNMEMPKNCTECEWHEYYGDWWLVDACRITGTMPIKNAKKGRADDCPLIPVPNHGRLVDADALIRRIYDAAKQQPEIADLYEDEADSMIAWLKTAPTIIPADKDGE